MVSKKYSCIKSVTLPASADGCMLLLLLLLPVHLNTVLLERCCQFT
jgi:hypothetical protein